MQNKTLNVTIDIERMPSSGPSAAADRSWRERRESRSGKKTDPTPEARGKRDFAGCSFGSLNKIR